ncbi:heparinase II/III family protein [Stieleria varia]|uniref:Heparinase II/III-like protein n=1 Tax=Stieleria varia TaxID=2528005 RepID=A0A5C6AKD5_9BACT|nr:heparinase II/III family protein [Stieleria varia]TWT98623.1 Heparinase II/III-like protein [Stieleria varia]
MLSERFFGRRLARVSNLLAYHKPSQLIGRAWKSVQLKVRRRLPERMIFQLGRDACCLRAGAKESLTRLSEKRLSAWSHRGHDGSQMAEGTFCFLNQSVRLTEQDTTSLQSIRWRGDEPRLWLFHLQCHEYLLELAEHDLEAANDLLRGWLSDPLHQFPDRDENAWHPFCISRRLRVWICFAAAFELEDDIETAFWLSVHDQLRWLARNLEWDLGGNHLLENLATLVFANCFLETLSGKSLPRFESRLMREIRLQVLPSGEHFERTPTYHAIMLFCVLELVDATEFASHPMRGQLVTVAELMCRWLQHVLHSDGSIPLFGDSAMDETPNPSVLFEWTGENSTIRFDGTETVAEPWVDCPSGREKFVFDVSDVGCDSLPAHAHADLLQVVASVAGRPLLVDSGNFDYEPSEMRRYCRATEAHNVLQVDGVDHCDLWSRFRMGRRGHITWRASGREDSLSWCVATHDAYRHLGVREVGRLVLADGCSWTVVDWIRSRGQHQLVSRLHVHPSWRCELSGASEVAELIYGQDIVRLRSLRESDRWGKGTGWYCPEFGVRHPNDVLQLSQSSSGFAWLGWTLTWGDQDREVMSVERIEVDGDFVRLGLQDGRCVQIPRAS